MLLVEMDGSKAKDKSQENELPSESVLDFLPSLSILIRGLATVIKLTRLFTYYGNPPLPHPSLSPFAHADPLPFLPSPLSRHSLSLCGTAFRSRSGCKVAIRADVALWVYCLVSSPCIHCPSQSKRWTDSTVDNLSPSHRLLLSLLSSLGDSTVTV